MVKVKDFTSETRLSDKGVYIITHNSTNIKYVGSTTTSFKERWRAHLNGLRRGIGNKVLVNICHKYDIEGFRFSILESMNNSSIAEIRMKEKYYIELYDTYKNGANCTLETDCAFKNFDRREYTEEDRIKYMLTSPTKKKVYLYDSQGNLLYIFPSSVSCDRFLGLPKRRTNWAINHPVRSLRGKYYPSYIEKEWCPIQEKYNKKCIAMKKVAKQRKLNGSYNVKDSQKNKIRQSNPKKRAVSLYDLEGNFIKSFISMNECDDYLNLHRGTTSKVFRGLTKVLRKKYIPKLI